MARLEVLSIANYRGAAGRLRLDFDRSKAIAVVFGENGTGKTTIADALDALGNCSIGSLEDRSSTSRAHLPTIGKSASDIDIQLTAGGNSWTATVSRAGVTCAPEPRPYIRILRRSHLLRLVNAEPAERYKGLQRFIDVEKVERAEAALAEACTAARRRVELTTVRRDTASRSLEVIWKNEGNPGEDALEWAKRESEADPAVLRSDARSLTETAAAVALAKVQLKEFDEAIAAAASQRQEVAAVKLEIENLPSADAPQIMGLTALLQRALEYLSTAPSKDACPVCQQVIAAEQLKTDLHARLQQFAPFEAVRQKEEAANTKVSTAQHRVGPEREKVLAASRSLLVFLKLPGIQLVCGVNADDTAFRHFAAADDNEPVALDGARKLIELLDVRCNALRQGAEDVLRRAGWIEALALQYKAYVEAAGALDTDGRRKRALDRALQVVRSTRIAFTQNILNSVTQECNRLYSFVHPGEALAISALELDPDKRASLNQRADFEGHRDVPPQAYFSESHLDTLGFCFWMALTKRDFPNKNAVIVLDDVFTSVDAQHLNRLAQLVIDESANFAHVLVTTHQRMWRDIYKNPHGAGRFTQLFELQRWTLPKGISSYRSLLAVEDLDQALQAAPFDRQAAASKAGILLEAMLDCLALQFRCRVARTHDGNYTLGELLDGTSSLFKKLTVLRPQTAFTNPAAAQQHAAQGAQGEVDGIRAMAFVRNQVGAHFNAAGSEISDRDVEGFAKATMQLAKALTCAVCGQIPSVKTGTHFQCSCRVPNDTRLHPLQL